MSGVPRRELVELLARYQLEPSIRDVFVEGEFDREILARCLEGGPQSGVSVRVYSIDSVNVPYEHLAHYGLTDGNKQRLVALAHELGRQGARGGYRCVVDRDLDHWFGPLPDEAGLRWTAYCDLDLYFYSDEIVHDVLQVTAQCRIKDLARLQTSIEDVLLQLYAFRLAERELQLSVSWLSFERCLSVGESLVVFDAEEYGRRLLNANGVMKRLTEWSRCVSAWRSKVGKEPRLAIRGHDFVALLAWVVRAFGGVKSFADAVPIRRLFVLFAPRVHPDLLALVE